MSRPLSLDDDDDFEEPRGTKRKSSAYHDGTGMMPAGSPVAVGLVLILAVGLVGSVIAGIGAISALRPLKKSGTEMAGGPTDTSADPES